MYLLAFFVLYFLLTFVWRTVLVYRRTGQNPLVLPARDDAYGYVGRAFKMVILCVALFVATQAFGPDHVREFSTITALVHTKLALMGWVLLWLSLVWLVIAQAQMGNSWRVGIDEGRRTGLITEGLFSISRNPIFLGMRFTMLGLFLVVPNAITLAIAVASELLMQIQVRLEEVHLSSMHDDEYTKYKNKVRRWL